MKIYAIKRLITEKSLKDLFRLKDYIDELIKYQLMGMGVLK